MNYRGFNLDHFNKVFTQKVLQKNINCLNFFPIYFSCLPVSDDIRLQELILLSEYFLFTILFCFTLFILVFLLVFIVACYNKISEDNFVMDKPGGWNPFPPYGPITGTLCTDFKPAVNNREFVDVSNNREGAFWHSIKEIRDPQKFMDTCIAKKHLPEIVYIGESRQVLLDMGDEALVKGHSVARRTLYHIVSTNSSRGRLESTICRVDLVERCITSSERLKRFSASEFNKKTGS